MTEVNGLVFVLLVGLLIVGVILGPLIVIWCIRTLFLVDLSYGFWEWLAALLLFGGGVWSWIGKYKTGD